MSSSESSWKKREVRQIAASMSASSIFSSQYIQYIDSSSFILDAIYVFGIYPWDEDGHARILYSTKRENKFLTFCFDKVIHKTLVKIEANNIKENMLRPIKRSEIKVETHFFNKNAESPYLHCFKFEVNPFTMPLFAHELSMSDIASKCEGDALFTNEICIAFGSPFPCYDFFADLLEWILQTDFLFKMEASGYILKCIEHKIDMDMALESQIRMESQRIIEDVIDNLQKTDCSNISPLLSIQCQLCEPFVWDMPKVFVHDQRLAYHSIRSLVKTMNPEQFVRIFDSVCLEYNVIIVHPDSCELVNTILAFHELIRPLKLEHISVPILPASKHEYLESPLPVLMGLQESLERVPSECAYLDTIRNELVLNFDLERNPDASDVQVSLEKHWEAARNGEMAAIKQIYIVVQGVVGRILDNLEACIVTDSTDTDRITSEFYEAMYLGIRSKESHQFYNRLFGVQMFKSYVDMLCLKKSFNYRQVITQRSP